MLTNGKANIHRVKGVKKRQISNNEDIGYSESRYVILGWGVGTIRKEDRIINLK